MSCSPCSLLDVLQWVQGNHFITTYFPKSLLRWALPPRQSLPSRRIWVEIHDLLQLQLCWPCCSHRHCPCRSFNPLPSKPAF